MNFEKKKLKIKKKLLILNVVEFPVFIITFLVSILLFAYNFIGLWIFFIEFGVIMSCWGLTLYLKSKLKGLNKIITITIY